ncbi:hypothetical protein [Sphingomonas sp.]|uniref:hypothetical protein n=1 Tax=Sphingomonas sp. TaxID=28214 RepID=UPI003B3AB68B
MSGPTIHGKTLTASAILREVGNDLSLIRQQDGLTWADLGKVLGRSDDQAAKYADGSAEMGIVAFGFGRREWGTRFTGSLDRLLMGCRVDAECDRGRQSHVLRAALALSVALEDDDQITPDEVRANRATIENAIGALEALLSKDTPR